MNHRLLSSSLRRIAGNAAQRVCVHPQKLLRGRGGVRLGDGGGVTATCAGAHDGFTAGKRVIELSYMLSKLIAMQAMAIKMRANS
jgi:hypothetical protein